MNSLVQVLFNVMLAMFQSWLVPSHHACKHKELPDLDMENPALHAAAAKELFLHSVLCMIQNRDQTNWWQTTES